MKTPLTDPLNVIDQHIGRQIRTLKALIGLGDAQLAAKMSFNLDELKAAEEGRRRLTPVELDRIAKLLHVDVPALFRGATIADEALDQGGPRSLEMIWTLPGFVKLARNFSDIDDPEMRAAIVQLVEVMAKKDRR